MATDARDRSEDHVEEPFELQELLGMGAFGSTYRAHVLAPYLLRDYGTDQVAVKIPLTPEKQLLLQKEVELNAALYTRLGRTGTPNLVAYLGFTVFHNQIVMVMEYVPDGSLRRRVGNVPRERDRSNRPLPLDETARLAMGILAGLSVIHRERVLHRDIKPENILLAGDVPKIADFGIGRMLGSNELATTTTGTLYYMSPEILQDQGVSYPADLWAVGVTLYEMVAGRLPFGHADTPPGRMVDLIRRSAPQPPSRVSGLPDTLDALILRALEKDPRRRFATATEMLAELRRTMEHGRGQPAPAEPEPIAPLALLKAGTEPAALEARLRDTIICYPDSPKGYEWLGTFYNYCQRYDQAIVVLEAGAQHKPADGTLHWQLALAYHKQGHPEQACAALRTAMALGLDARRQQHAAQLLRRLGGGDA